MKLFYKKRYSYSIEQICRELIKEEFKLEELIMKAKKEDKEAFTQLILNIKNDLYKIAKMRITNEEDIQDVIQETMIDAYKYIRKLKDITKFKPWIIKILINNANKMYNRKMNRKEVYNGYDIEFYKDEIKSCEDIKLKEDTLDFYEMIKELKYEERIIIILYYSEKYTTKEISNILKINENTIKTRLSRAKEKIKNKYEGGKQVG